MIPTVPFGTRVGGPIHGRAGGELGLVSTALEQENAEAVSGS